MFERNIPRPPSRDLERIVDATRDDSVQFRVKRVGAVELILLVQQRGEVCPSDTESS